MKGEEFIKSHSEWTNDNQRSCNNLTNHTGGIFSVPPNLNKSSNPMNNSAPHHNEKESKAAVNYLVEIANIEDKFQSDFRLYKYLLISEIVLIVIEAIAVAIIDKKSQGLEINHSYFLLSLVRVFIFGFGVFIFRNRGFAKQQKFFIIFSVLSTVTFLGIVIAMIFIIGLCTTRCSHYRGSLIALAIIHFFIDVILPSIIVKFAVKAKAVFERKETLIKASKAVSQV